MVKQMKSKDYKDALRAKSLVDLKKEENDLKDQLFKLRFKHATRHVDNPLEIKYIKRDIARVKTIIREKEMATDSK